LSSSSDKNNWQENKGEVETNCFSTPGKYLQKSNKTRKLQQNITPKWAVPM